MAIRTFGPNAVDWEERVDLDRLREERLARARKSLEESALGALLTFDFANIRYLTSTHIGTWAMRPGDPAFFDILHSYLGYRTCYYRTFAVGSASMAQRDAYVRCREYMDAAIALVKPGVTTADVVSLWPRAEEFGFADEEAAFALQYGHGGGLAIWEKPIFSRLVSLEHPEVLEEGMVFALETYWPAGDGWSAARIEEELVVTADGCEVITKFPAEDLLVAGRKYWTVGGQPNTLREAQSHLNTAAGRGEAET